MLIAKGLNLSPAISSKCKYAPVTYYAIIMDHSGKEGRIKEPLHLSIDNKYMYTYICVVIIYKPATYKQKFGKERSRERKKSGHIGFRKQASLQE